MNLLPKWAIVNTFPAIHDFESLTVIEQTARVYGAMQTLINEYNAFAEATNEYLASFTDEETDARKEFELQITKVMNEFTCSMERYLKLNLDDTATKVIIEGLNAGSIRVPTDKTLTKKEYPAEAAATAERIENRAAQLAEEIAVERARISNLASLETGSTTGDAELADIRIGYNGVNYQTAGEAVRAQGTDFNARLNKTEKALNAYNEVPFDGVEKNMVYSSNSPSGTALSGYDTYYKAVSPGEVYYIDTNVVPTAAFSAVTFYRADNAFLGTAGRYSEGVTQTNKFVVEIPANCVLVRACVKNDTIPELFTSGVSEKNILEELKKFRPNNYVSFVDDVCKVKAKYNGQSDLIITIRKRGGNNIPDISFVGTVENSGDLNNNTTESRTIINNYTDYFSPHIVSAVNNGNGDTPNNKYFTGGNHQNNNQGTGGAVTARCESFDVWCDNVPVSGEAFGNEVKVKWINYIQGYNTTTATGNGREILKEEITLTIRGTRVDVDIRHRALENIVREKYYGLQMQSSFFSVINYIGGSNRKSENTTESSNSGDNNCRAIRLSKDNDVLEIGIDTVDLGRFCWSDVAHSAYNMDYGKSYFNIINSSGGKHQASGEVTTTRGYYLFMCEQ